MNFGQRQADCPTLGRTVCTLICVFQFNCCLNQDPYYYCLFTPPLGNFQLVSEPGLTSRPNRREKMMSTMGNSPLDSLLLDGYNYNSWCTHILSTLHTIDPMFFSIVDVTISPMRKENAYNAMLKLLMLF